MSKILLINGSPNQKGCTNAALEEMVPVFAAAGVESEILWLGNKPMQDCIACGSCRKAGKCVFDDLVNRTAGRLDEFDGMVIGSPVYYSGATGRVTSFLDRLFFSAPKQKFTGKLGAAVVSCRRAGSTATFQRLNQYFLIQNMVVVGSQYWNEVHGNSTDEVAKDEEGRQSLRTLAQNMVWLLRCKEAGEKAGISLPDYEPRVATNFIR